MPKPAPMPHPARELKRALLSGAAIALGLAAPLTPPPAAAQSASAAEAPADGPLEERREHFAYKFYVGGVLVGKALINTAFRGESYHSATELETDGVVGWFVEAKFNASAKGAVGADAALRPTTLLVKGVSDKKPWRMTMTYEGDRPSAVEVEPPFRKRHYDIDPTEQTGALDPISALVAALLPAPSKTSPSKTTPCERTIPIFDGRRRYDVVLEKEISAQDGVIECASRFKRVGGFKEKQLDKPDYLFTTRFEMRDGYAVPTKIWGDTEFGGAVAILRK